MFLENLELSIFQNLENITKIFAKIFKFLVSKNAIFGLILVQNVVVVFSHGPFFVLFLSRKCFFLIIVYTLVNQIFFSWTLLGQKKVLSMGKNIVSSIPPSLFY